MTSQKPGLQISPALTQQETKVSDLLLAVAPVLEVRFDVLSSSKLLEFSQSPKILLIILTTLRVATTNLPCAVPLPYPQLYTFLYATIAVSRIEFIFASAPGSSRHELALLGELPKQPCLGGQ